MTDTRKWSALAAVLVVAIFAAGWFLLISPKRGEAADLRGKADAKAQANASLQEQIAMLQEQQKGLPTQQAQLAAMRTQIPTNPALPSLVRDLTAAADKVGADLDALAPSAPQPISAPGAVGAAPVPATGAPASTAPVLYQVPMTLNVTGSYFELEQFLGKLEGLKRSFLVSSFALAPKASEEAPSDLGLTITGRVFLSPDVSTTTSTPVTPVAPAATS